MSDIMETGNVSINNQEQLLNMLKDLVKETIKVNQDYSDFIRQYVRKKTKVGKASFRFPFILREKDIYSFDTCVKSRLSHKYYNNYELSFLCQVEFMNNEKLLYESIDELMNANHNKAMLRIHMQWTYTIVESVNDFHIPIPYDIHVYYEIEQDSDQRELYTLEEWGIISVEGSENDWINGTIKELKALTVTTKMPFWWYYPKKVFLALREYTSAIIWILALACSTIFILPAFFNADSLNAEFINKTRQIVDTAEKLQEYIEFSLAPAESNRSILIIYLIVTICAAVITVLTRKGLRYIFPSSMILIGNQKDKLENRYKAYCFIWGGVLCSIIGLIIAALF